MAERVQSVDSVTTVAPTSCGYTRPRAAKDLCLWGLPHHGIRLRTVWGIPGCGWHAQVSANAFVSAWTVRAETF